MKRNPAMIIGIAECGETFEKTLREPGCQGNEHAPSKSLDRRDAFAYLTLRGTENNSVLIGVRERTGSALELLDWERRFEGKYKRKGGNGDADAYSRCLVAKVHTDVNVNLLGTSHIVMVIHVHNLLANNKWPQRLKKFWEWLMEKLQKHNVKVLMGDFNMALFQVIPELRSRGATVDLGAWFPWKSLEGTAMSDSCGIFFLDMPGDYSLYKTLDDLNAERPDGILTKAQPVDDTVKIEHGFVRCAPNGGPGQPLVTYLNKKKSLHSKIEPTLTPSEKSIAAVEKANGKGKGKGGMTVFKIHEKRLLADLWRFQGKEYRGSHFPICAFTCNKGRRSPERLAARARRSRTKKQPPDAAGRSSGDAREPAGGDPHPVAWFCTGWDDGTSIGWWTEVMRVPWNAHASSFAAEVQADRRQTDSSGDWQYWRGWNNM